MVYPAGMDDYTDPTDLEQYEDDLRDRMDTLRKERLEKGAQ